MKIVVSLVFALSLVGCGGSDDVPGDSFGTILGTARDGGEIPGTQLKAVNTNRRLLIGIVNDEVSSIEYAVGADSLDGQGNTFASAKGNELKGVVDPEVAQGKCVVTNTYPAFTSPGQSVDGKYTVKGAQCSVDYKKTLKVNSQGDTSNRILISTASTEYKAKKDSEFDNRSDIESYKSTETLNSRNRMNSDSGKQNVRIIRRINATAVTKSYGKITLKRVFKNRYSASSAQGIKEATGITDTFETSGFKVVGYILNDAEVSPRVKKYFINGSEVSEGDYSRIFYILQ